MQMYSMGSTFTNENTLEGVLISSSFQTSPKLNLSDFDWYYDLSYGNCYTFNSGSRPIENYKIGGSEYGLKLEIYLGNPNDSIDRNNEIIDSIGMNVFVHNQTDRPPSSKVIEVSSGVKTNIAINRVFDIKLEQPYSNCTSDLNTLNAFDSDLYRATFKAYQTYTQKKCLDLCLQNVSISVCGCHNAFYNGLNSEKSCEALNESLCLLNTKQFIFNSSDCFSDCPFECEKITYLLSTSHSYYPSPEYTKFLKTHPIIQKAFNSSSFDSNSIDEDLLKKSIASINVFYDDLRYTKISQTSKMNLVDLMSNIGGTLGLYLGMSFLSFVEIFEAIIQAFIILFEKKNKT